MASATRNIFVRLLCSSVAFLAFVSVSSTAEADCGDYVIIGRPLHLDLSQLDASTRFRLMIGADIPTTDPAKPRPCRGPGCSNSDPVPLTPTVSVSSPSEHWALYRPSDGSPPLDQGLAFLDSLLEIGEPHPKPIEHPPRSV